VIARIRNHPSDSAMPCSSAMSFTSTNCPGAANRSFINGIRLIPPARTFAPSWISKTTLTTPGPAVSVCAWTFANAYPSSA
jgi:hypothetical protein